MTHFIRPPHWFNRLPATYKLAISAIIGTVCFALLLPVPMETITRIMISWDVFSSTMIGMILATFLTMRPRQIRVLAKFHDSSGTVVLCIVIVSTLCSLMAIMILLSSRGGWLLNKRLETVIYIFGVICSWLLLHTTFTYRYAHLYYGDHSSIPDTHTAGMAIPDELWPDYLDFAYFSFTIGMTFQVSDIQITSRPIRRLALLHSILAFLFDTVIVALSINAVLDLKG